MVSSEVVWFAVGAAGEGSDASIRIPVKNLRPGPRVRKAGFNRDQVDALSRSVKDWPPIVVRRMDHTIVDGHHRYLAARQLGLCQMDCVYFEGTSESAFLEALKRNLHHGLPLSLKERESAGYRVLEIHPEWSDRRVAEACGLAPGTVARLRNVVVRPDGGDAHSTGRFGRDGRSYPANPGASRERILRVLREQPEMSLRAVARATGTSQATVRAAKARLAEVRTGEGTQASPPLPSIDTAGLCSSAGRISDAAVLSTDDGRKFADWFGRTRVSEEDWRALIECIPISRVYEVADEARRRGDIWLRIASALESSVRQGRVQVSG